MKLFSFLLLAALALGTPAAAPAQQAAAQRDWSTAIARTPQGGYLMGNPDAPVKLVEYLSLTCPHCAAFAREGTPRLIADYVRSGRVSLEYRNFVLNPTDAMASVLVRCAPPEHYFAMTEELFRTQEEWVPRVNGALAAQRSQVDALPVNERLARIAEIGGMLEFAGRHGLAADEARRCMSDEQSMFRISEIAQAAEEMHVEGTPTFFINGEMSDAIDWAALEPRLRAAIGG